MPLRKVAPTTQWPTQRRGKSPTALKFESFTGADGSTELALDTDGTLALGQFTGADGSTEFAIGETNPARIVTINQTIYAV